MPVNVQLESLILLDAPDELRKSLGLGRITLALSFEILGAGVGGSALAVPFVPPVAVDVVPEAIASLCRLAVLAPHAVGCLGIFET